MVHDRKNHHFLYEIFRAGSIQELIPKGATVPPATDERVSSLEATLAEMHKTLADQAAAFEAALAEKERVLAEKDAALEVLQKNQFQASLSRQDRG